MTTDYRSLCADHSERIAALEAQRETEKAANHFPDATKMVPAPAGGLVERVAEIISNGDDGHHWTEEARAAIKAVAAWLEAHDVAVGRVSSRWLRQEVVRG